MSGKDLVQMSIKVPRELADHLAKISEDLSTSMSEIIRKVFWLIKEELIYGEAEKLRGDELVLWEKL